MIDRFEHSPWDFWSEAGDAAHQAQSRLQRALVDEHPAWRIGDRCFISTLASVHPDAFTLGDRSYVAAGAYVTGDISIGADCSVNPDTAVRGRVVMGDGVRIGAHTSILGFNHTMSDPTLPVHRQPLTTRGIEIGDDVWIGSHVVILDGVRVGSHSVLAAGAIVTRNVPDGAIVGGNPARFLRWRIAPTDVEDPVPTDLTSRLTAFGETARSQIDGILRAHVDADLQLMHDGGSVTVRAQCDAIELADLFSTSAPIGDLHDRLTAWLHDDGAVASLRADGTPGPVDPTDADTAYHVLSVGYALDLAQAPQTTPVRFLPVDDPAALVAFVDALPWQADAWHAGHWVDALGTALRRNLLLGDPTAEASLAALIGWLTLNVDPRTGMWGTPTPDRDMLPVVNGWYRAVRGTFAQFGLPVPHPDRVVDTVLAHAADQRWFARDRLDACNVLDVVHPLWLTRANGHRAEEVRRLAERLLDAALDVWITDAGFAFRVGGEPELRGTEMWSAIVWLLADLLGLADALGYRPRGVHRPEAAVALTRR